MSLSFLTSLPTGPSLTRRHRHTRPCITTTRRPTTAVLEKEPTAQLTPTAPSPAVQMPDHWAGTNTAQPDLALVFSTYTGPTTPCTFPITGTLPAYLHNATYFRTGPGRFEIERKDGSVWKAMHAFDASSLLVSFRIDSSSSTLEFRSKFNSRTYEDTIASGTARNSPGMTLVWRGKRSFWQKVREWRPPAIDWDIAMPPPNYIVLLEEIPGKGLCVRTDAAVAQQIDDETLEPTGQFTFSRLDKRISGLFSMSHGLTDRRTKEYFNMTWQPALRDTTYTVFKMRADGSTTILTEFRHLACYVHSACLTDKYIIAIMCPQYFNLPKLALSMDALGSLERWEGAGVTFFVISRRDGAVVKRITHPYFSSMHSLNAYDSGDDDVVIDLVLLNDSVLHPRTPQQLLDAELLALENRLPLTRLVLRNVSNPNVMSRVESRTLLRLGFEWMTTSPLYERRPYRYGYGLVTSTTGCTMLAKLDVERKVPVFWTGDGYVASEPVFVPNPDGTAEDDGCLLSVVADTVNKKSLFVVLDARDMSEMARATLPFLLPIGFHAFLKP